MRRSTALLIVLAVSLTACNKSPTAPGPTPPPPPANVGGNWSGTWEEQDGVAAFVMNLNQSGTTVTGTWAVSGINWSGNVSGTVDTSSFTGNLTVNAPRQGGGTCTGTAAFSGPASAGSQTLRLSSVGITGNCTFGTGSITINAQRR